MASIDDTTFEKAVLKADDVVLVDFYADWCGPCRALAPTIEQLAKSFKGKVHFYRLNVDECPITSGKYFVDSIPAIKIFKKGQVVSESYGLTSEANLSLRISKALKH